MKNPHDDDWRVLSRHDQWAVEYRMDSSVLRIRAEGVTLYLDRDGYRLLWGLLSYGLDELERLEEAGGQKSARSALLEAALSGVCH